MENVLSENDDCHRMGNFNFKKPIKVTCVIEDADSDEINKFEKPIRYASQTIEKTDSAAEQLNTPSTDQHYHDNGIFNEKRVNIGHERHNISNGTVQINRNVHLQTINNNAVSNITPPSPLEKLKKTSETLLHNHLISNEKHIYIKLLDTVSENLLKIIKYYHHYNNVSHTAKNSFQEKYLQIKNYYFSDAYNIVVTMFLPREYNQAFKSNFIRRTFEIANRKLFYPPLNVETIESLVNNMIDWVKEEKRYRDSRENRLQQLLCGPRASFIASAPTTLPATTALSSLNSIHHGDPRQPLNRPSAPLVTSASPTPTVPRSNYEVDKRQQTNGLPRFSSLPHVPVAPLDSPTLHGANGNYNGNIHQQTSRFTTVISNIHQQSKWHQTVSPTQQLNKPSPVLPIQQLNKPSPVLPTQQQNKSPRDSVSEGHKNNICLFSTGPSGSEISISVDPSLAKTVSALNKRKSAQNPTSKKRRTTDNSVNPTILPRNSTWCPTVQNQLPHNDHSPKEAPWTTNADSINAAVQPVNNSNEFYPGARQHAKESDNNECEPPISRSVSRDSGVGSPALYSLLTNNDNNMACTDIQEVTTGIAHVTSLNSSPMYITNGSCKICGSTTNNVCIKCNNEYYCGTVCQYIDWPMHKETCWAR